MYITIDSLINLFWKDASISVLSRRFIENIDELARGKEMNLLYLEAALRAIPCHKTFFAYFEHIRKRPKSFLHPLASFLELPEKKIAVSIFSTIFVSSSLT